MKTFCQLITLFILFSSCASKKHTHERQEQEQPILSSSSSSAGSAQQKSGSYVFINQVAYEVNGTLDEVLNEELRKHEGETVLVELNTTSYEVNAPILLPSKIQSRVIIEGNHATINSSIAEDEFVFTKLGDYSHGLTGIADTYQEVRNLTIKGGGGGVFFQGGYQSKVVNVMTRGCSNGVRFEFILQGLIDKCHIKAPSEIGICMTVVSGTNVSASQSNLGVISNCRIYAKDTQVGVFVANSNLVKIEGNVIEGGVITKGIHVHNFASTVISCTLNRNHFECSEFKEACVYTTGNWRDVNINEMYYSGKKGRAVMSKPSKSIRISLRKSWVLGWENCLYEVPRDWPQGKMARSTKWKIYDSGMKSIESLFDGEIKARYTYNSDVREILKPFLIPID